MVGTETVGVEDENSQTKWSLLSCTAVCCKDPVEFLVQTRLFYDRPCLADFSLLPLKPTNKRKRNNRLNKRTTKHRHQGRVDLEFGKFSETKKTLLTFLIDHVRIFLECQLIVQNSA